jgi:ABC-type Fe3+/spermidine/putrescine transport system ATPase subunit
MNATSATRSTVSAGSAVPTASAAAPSLEIADLHLSYGGFAALKGIELSVARGEFVALLGPSGCGKTSLLRTIAGFVHPQRGSVKLNGHDVAKLPPRERNIGLVFQSYALFPHMSVIRNVRFGLECRGVPEKQSIERAQTAMALVGLSEFADRLPKQLSGGQQQRVALARALVIEPDLLLLDEPLGALDKRLRTQMQTELKALQRRVGVTAVFVTHDQEEAMSMADRIVVMRNGTIMQIDAPEALFARPASAWVCDFIGAGNLLRGELRPSTPGAYRMELAPGAAFEVESALQPAANSVLFVPADRVRLTPSPEGRGLQITSRRYLGLAVELTIAHANGTLVTQVPVEATARYPVGSFVEVGAERRDCRLLPDD